MLDSTHRFHGQASLRFVYQRGQNARGQMLSLRFILNSRQQTYRMAVVVGRKINKSAVVRNRIRRRIYEAVRLQASQITEPYDLVFAVYSDALAEIPAVELRQKVTELLQDAKILKAMV